MSVACLVHELGALKKKKKMKNFTGHLGVT